MHKRVLLLAALSLLFVSFSAQAQSVANRYSAEVNIDVTAENASQARDKGMKQAYRSAFLAIAGKMTNTEGLSKLSELTDEQLINFIQETEVVSEKSSDVRYIASLKIKINENLLKQFMAEQNIPYVIKTASNIVIIPIFREYLSDSPLLWEKENLWKKAWETTSLTSSDNNYIVLPEDGINASVLTAEKALQLNSQALDTISSHLGTKNIYVLDAYYNGIEGLNVVVSDYQNGLKKTISVNGERSPALFAQAIPAVTQYIDGTVEEQNISMNTQPSEITVLYSYKNLSNWLNTERKLRNIAQINDITVDAMGQGKVQFRIKFIGSLLNLTTALKGQQINLNDMSGYYSLSNNGD